MTDPRIDTLAKNLIGFSCNVQKGENVMIEIYGDCDALLLALICETYAAGANPFVWRRDNEVQRAIAMGATDAQLSLMARVDAELMENMQAYIGIRGGMCVLYVLVALLLLVAAINLIYQKKRTD